MATFNELHLSDSVMQAINNMGFEEATPIQEKAIPMAMEGKDLIGQAQTGTGKTAAFSIPMVEALDAQSETIQGMVIVPTRELALQVAEELNRIGQFKGIHTLPIYGGQDIKWQIKALKNKPQIITGTPGRLIDHIVRRRTIKSNDIKIVVLDEADEMLDMGFIEDIETILETTPVERQTMLFSATIPKPVQKLAQRFMDNPVKISLGEKSITVPSTEQVYLETPEKQKFEVLSRMLDIHLPELAIVFVRTKRRVDELAEALTERGYPASGIHGDMPQSRRESTLRQFRDGKIDILVATDVAARGLDIRGVTHIYNFDIPQDPDSYVHRIGRTGRAGKAGMAMTFVTPREITLLKLIEKVIKHKIAREPVPTVMEAMEERQRATIEELLRVSENADISLYRSFAESLLERSDPITIISAALKMIGKEHEKAPVELTEAPWTARYRKRAGKEEGGRRHRERGPKTYAEKRRGREVSRRR